VTLCSSLSKGDRQRWLIEKAVELGVRRFVPFNTKRGVVAADAQVCDRLRRAVVEASKQSGRNRLMEIGDATSMPPRGDWISGDVAKYIAHPGGDVTLAALGEELRASPTAPVAFLIGPEGGFTNDEVAAAESAGWRKLSLGPRILRIETAATMLAACAASA
jgi:16S rRNA (uracil1498-N3)-methyltransferase